MPRPFLELTIDQFADLLKQFPWRRKISEVHVHHTFRPNHADFALRPPIQSIEAMFRFHTQVEHFGDIAQHLTIDPNGAIWTGRNWNSPPASAVGFNGNATTGPFMFEMIGDFDTGNDKWEGAQRDTAVEVIARVQRLFGLPPTAFRFHHEMNPKSCPGTSIKKPEVLALVEQAHERLAVPRSVRRGAFDETASADRATAERLLRLFNVDTSGRALTEDGELREANMTLNEMAMASGDPSATALSRDADTSDLTPEQLTTLRKYVINLRMGALSAGGVFQTDEADVRAIFAEHLPAFLEQRKNEGGKLKLVFFAHGGLNDEVQSLKNARNRFPFYLANKCYPIFFVWETGVKETLVDILGEIVGLGPGRGIGEAVTNLSDAALESAFRNVGFSMWTNMKRSAEIAFLPRQGGTFFVEQLAEFWREHSADMEIHAIGHSAGSIFHAQFLNLLCEQPSNPPVHVESLNFLAPAITVDLFKDKLMPLMGGRIKALAEFTMHKDFELADSVGPYRKSLLYLVSRSFEDSPETPILGLEESIRRDPEMIRFFGLLGNKPKAEILFSVQQNGPSHSTIAKKHGDFDNDQFTMAGVMRRILRVSDAEPIVEFPETVSRNVLNTPPAAKAAPAPSAPAPAPAGAPAIIAGAGRRIALCIGIDEYDPPNRLGGCVNDARDWAAALKNLGFEASLLLNKQATWQAVSDGIAGLVSGTRPGDVAVLQYSGHGTRVEDLDGDEQGGMDSALCPVDFPAGGFLIDDDVRRILGQSLPEGVNLTCFFDCCHSGTITRLVAPTPSRARGAVRVRGFHATPEMMQAHRQFRGRLALTAPRPRGPATMKEISFAACTDAQTAQEIDGHGVFTTKALAILRGGIGSLTNGSFLNQVLAAFAAEEPPQTPQLDCAPASNLRPLLAPLVSSPEAGTPAAAPTLEAIVARLNEFDRRLAKLGA